MAESHVVIDGSNLATEGRSVPSLAQLRDAVAAFRAEYPDDWVTVVVDASFGYRIDESERAAFEEAEAAGELVSPPAGAIGRGDGFLLQIADRTGAVVLSNDSFQEFHGVYDWLFERGRLIGGKPVPGVGWIFSLRSPVRGARSRGAVADVKRKAKEADEVARAIAEAREEAKEPGSSRSSKRRRRGVPPPGAVNEPLPFITFIANHRLGSEVEGEVDRFSSHGAFVKAAGASCYIPLTAMGEPPPRSARSVLRRGDVRTFVIQAFDAPRRGIELALPGFAQVAAAPTEETVEAEISEGTAAAATSSSSADGSAHGGGGRRSTKTASEGGSAKGADASASEAEVGAAKDAVQVGMVPASTEATEPVVGTERRDGQSVASTRRRTRVKETAGTAADGQVASEPSAESAPLDPTEATKAPVARKSTPKKTKTAKTSPKTPKVSEGAEQADGELVTSPKKAPKKASKKASTRKATTPKASKAAVTAEDASGAPDPAASPEAS